MWNLYLYLRIILAFLVKIQIFIVYLWCWLYLSLCIRVETSWRSHWELWWVPQKQRASLRHRSVVPPLSQWLTSPGRTVASLSVSSSHQTPRMSTLPLPWVLWPRPLPPHCRPHPQLTTPTIHLSTRSLRRPQKASLCPQQTHSMGPQLTSQTPSCPSLLCRIHSESPRTATKLQMWRTVLSPGSAKYPR